jgi:hypothetical protein
MRLLPVALALALTAASAHAGDEVRPLPGESPSSFRCRARYVPEARRCMARCQEQLAGENRASERGACVDACTVAGMHAIADCRKASAGIAPPAPLATR